METKLPEGFTEFWILYPRRVAKLAAIKAYEKALKHADAATINQGAYRYHRERANENPQYTAHPATWLNAGRWMDEVQTNGDKRSILGAIDRLESNLNCQGGSSDIFGLSPRRLC